MQAQLYSMHLLHKYLELKGNFLVSIHKNFIANLTKSYLKLSNRSDP